VPATVATGTDEETGTRINKYLRNVATMMAGYDFELSASPAGFARLSNVPKTNIIS
jgi:hypothetical protein